MNIKVYIVQAISGDILDAKLTFEAAHAVAKEHAPAQVVRMLANKDPRITSDGPTFRQVGGPQ